MVAGAGAFTPSTTKDTAVPAAGVITPLANTPVVASMHTWAPRARVSPGVAASATFDQPIEADVLPMPGPLRTVAVTTSVPVPDFT